MSKIIQYLENLDLALTRVPKAVLGTYHYHPSDGYVKNVAVTFDLLGNTLAGGDPDETISSRVAKSRTEDKWACYFCKVLTWFQNVIFMEPGDHCTGALDRNVGSRAVIPDEST